MTRHCHPEFVVCIRVPSWCCTFQMCVCVLVHLKCTFAALKIQDSYFSMFLHKKVIALCLVFNCTSFLYSFYNDFTFIVYFTLRSAFNTISTEREKLKQLMEQDTSSSPSAQVVGLKHALSSVSYMSVSQERLAMCSRPWISLYCPSPRLCWKCLRKPNKWSKLQSQLSSDLLILKVKTEPTPNLSS